MVPVPLPTNMLQQAGQDGKTVFKAQINVDKKEYNPHAKNPPELSNNLITDLIKEFHSKKVSGANMNNIIQGMGLDPNLVDKFHQNHPLSTDNLPPGGDYASPERISHQQQNTNTEP